MGKCETNRHIPATAAKNKIISLTLLPLGHALFTQTGEPGYGTELDHQSVYG